ARFVACCDVGPVQRFQLALDQLDPLQDLTDVGIHLGPQGLHGLGIVHGLAFLVGFLQSLLQLLHCFHVVLDVLDVLEELVEVRVLLPGLQVVHLSLLPQIGVLLE
ncbi:unnamed protein product, partial [Linum tenue]